MTDQRFAIIFAQGTTEQLQSIMALDEVVATSVEVPEDLYDFLYNSLLEKATTQRREARRGRS
ncbi:hypothetical protein [Methanoculleus sp. UBA312]|uniref:hypothetical protein n=1 Tax=Methanoculleus sp. UBA312 TaxID=1915499 RepID=UPI0031BB3477